MFFLLSNLHFLKDKFKTFDKDLSGDIDTFELAQAFGSIGISACFDPISNNTHLNGSFVPNECL